MHDLSVLLTFAGGLAAALLLGYLAHRLRISPVVGYLLAGVAIGPFTPGFVADRHIAEQFAEIGVILLLFGIGLRFHLRELLAVWRIAVPGALIQSTLSTLTLAVLLHLAGVPWSSGIVLGLAISVASTVVMARVLSARGDLHAQIGYIAIGWTVVEDLITVTLLLLLPIIFSDAESGPAVGEALGSAALKLGGLVVTVIVLGRWVIPRFLERIAATRSGELFTLSVLVLAVGIAVGAAELFGVSMALGAFLAGLAVGRSEFAARAANDALPMRDAFAVLFFVSAGMLFDPESLVRETVLIVMVMFVVVIGKPVAAMLTVRLLGKPMNVAVPVGAAFAQVGEFSFVLASVALSLGVISNAGWNAVVASSILSIALNPVVYGWAKGLVSKSAKVAPEVPVERPPVDPRRCILIGYGPVGRTVHRILRERGAHIVVIELNLETVRRLRSEGCEALYGDVLRPGTLEEAGVLTAGSLVLSTNLEDAAEVVRAARLLNPELHIMARCTHLREVEELRRAGATLVAAGEVEVAVALAEAVTGPDDSDPLTLASQREAIRKRLYDPEPPTRTEGQSRAEPETRTEALAPPEA